MGETRREQVASWIGLVTVLFPAMILSGFFPDWNVLPAVGWAAIATMGSAVAGAVATPYFVRGTICGLMAGLGAMIGMGLYVAIRSALFGQTFWSLELVLAALAGGAPGMLLYSVWARPNRV